VSEPQASDSITDKEISMSSQSSPGRVLAAIDLSSPSDDALRSAYELARTTGARLSVCHVVPSMTNVYPFFPQHNQAAMVQWAELAPSLRQAVERHVADVTGRDDLEVFVENGTDYAEIVRRAEAWQADLVVVGSHGRSGIARLLLGSVAEQVVRHAACSVMVVRVTESRGSVLVATDLSDPSLPAVAAGIEAASRLKARLIVMHAVDFSGAALPTVLGPFGATAVVPSVEDQRSVREALESMLRDVLTRFGAEGEVRVVEGPAAANIVRIAEEVKAELLVVGTRGRTGLTRLALGSVAERAVRGAPCSVLAVRLE
jgi:nucleotide-binding universal stress UspA family protein